MMSFYSLCVVESFIFSEYYAWSQKYKRSFVTVLPRLIYWNLWKPRNSIFFDPSNKSADLVVERTLRANKELYSKPSKVSKIIKRSPTFINNTRWCLFDGVCKGKEWVCGSGIVVNATDQLSFHR